MRKASRATQILFGAANSARGSSASEGQKQAWGLASPIALLYSEQPNRFRELPTWSSLRSFSSSPDASSSSHQAGQKQRQEEGSEPAYIEAGLLDASSAGARGADADREMLHFARAAGAAAAPDGSSPDSADSTGAPDGRVGPTDDAEAAPVAGLDEDVEEAAMLAEGVVEEEEEVSADVAAAPGAPSPSLSPRTEAIRGLIAAWKDREEKTSGENLANVVAAIENAYAADIVDNEVRSLALWGLARHLRGSKAASKAQDGQAVRQTVLAARAMFHQIASDQAAALDGLSPRQLYRLLSPLSWMGVNPFDRMMRRGDLHRKLLEAIGGIEPDKAATIFSMLHSLDMRPTPELHRACLDRALAANLSDMRAASILYAIVKLAPYAAPQPEQLNRIIQDMLGDPHQYRAWRWVELLHCLAALRFRPREDVLDQIAQQLETNVNSLRIPNMGQMFRAFGLLEYWPKLKVIDKCMSVLDPALTRKARGGEESGGDGEGARPPRRNSSRVTLNYLDAFDILTSLAHIHYYPGVRRMHDLMGIVQPELSKLDPRRLCALLWAYGRLLHRTPISHISEICDQLDARYGARAPPNSEVPPLPPGAAACALRALSSLSLYSKYPQLTSMMALYAAYPSERESLSETASSIASRLGLMLAVSLFDSHPAVTILMERLVRGPLDGLDASTLVKLGHTMDNLAALSPHGPLYRVMLGMNPTLKKMIHTAQELQREFNRNLKAGADPVVTRRAQELSAALTLLGVPHEPMALRNGDLIFYEAVVENPSVNDVRSSAVRRSPKLRDSRVFALRFYEDPLYFRLHSPPSMLRGERIGHMAIRNMVHGFAERFIDGLKWDTMRAEDRVSLLRRELSSVQAGLVTSSGGAGGASSRGSSRSGREGRESDSRLDEGGEESDEGWSGDESGSDGSEASRSRQSGGVVGRSPGAPAPAGNGVAAPGSTTTAEAAQVPVSAV